MDIVHESEICTACQNHAEENRLRTLSCEHSLCKTCIQANLDNGSIGDNDYHLSIVCKVCQQMTKLNKEEVDEFKKPLDAIHAVDAGSEMNEVQSPKEKQLPPCSVHSAEQLKFTCVKCNTFICRKCRRDNHLYHAVKDINIDEEKNGMIPNIDRIKKMEHSAETFIQDIEKQIAAFGTKETELISQIERRAKEMMDMINNEKNKAIEHSKHICKKEADNLNDQKQKVDNYLKYIKDVEDKATKLRQSDNDEFFLNMKGNVDQTLRKAIADGARLNQGKGVLKAEFKIGDLEQAFIQAVNQSFYEFENPEDVEMPTDDVMSIVKDNVEQLGYIVLNVDTNITDMTVNRDSQRLFFLTESNAVEYVDLKSNQIHPLSEKLVQHPVALSTTTDGNVYVLDLTTLGIHLILMTREDITAGRRNIKQIYQPLHGVDVPHNYGRSLSSPGMAPMMPRQGRSLSIATVADAFLMTRRRHQQAMLSPTSSETKLSIGSTPQGLGALFGKMSSTPAFMPTARGIMMTRYEAGSIAKIGDGIYFLGHDCRLKHQESAQGSENWTNMSFNPIINCMVAAELTPNSKDGTQMALNLYRSGKLATTVKKGIYFRQDTDEFGNTIVLEKTEDELKLHWLEPDTLELKTTGEVKSDFEASILSIFMSCSDGVIYVVLSLDDKTVLLKYKYIVGKD